MQRSRSSTLHCVVLCCVVLCCVVLCCVVLRCALQCCACREMTRIYRHHYKLTHSLTLHAQ
jgi:hypothetical protein